MAHSAHPRPDPDASPATPGPALERQEQEARRDALPGQLTVTECFWGSFQQLTSVTRSSAVIEARDLTAACVCICTLTLMLYPCIAILLCACANALVPGDTMPDLACPAVLVQRQSAPASVVWRSVPDATNSHAFSRQLG